MEVFRKSVWEQWRIFCWVYLGILAEKIAGVRSGVRLVSGKVRSHAELCPACDQYKSMD